jgi:hypothetical protein
MDYDLQISQDGSYIIVRFLSDITTEIGEGANKDASDFGAKHGISRYLHDLRQVRCIEKPTNQYLSAYKTVHGLGIDRASKIAMLTSPDDHSHDFIEVLWQNNNFNVKIFRDENSAIKWLLT